VFGNISTDICAVTAQHSLSPISDTCTAMGWSRDQLSQSFESYTSLPRSEVRAWWVRRLLSTEGFTGYGRTSLDFSPTPCTFLVQVFQPFHLPTITISVTDSHMFAIPST